MALQNQTEVATRTDEEVAMPPWLAGVIAGLAGGAVMGVMATMMLPTVMTEYIPGLIGLDGLVAGWIVHLSIAAVFGVGYAALATETDFVDHSPSYRWDIALGLGYGAVLWLVAMVIVMPIWLGTLGTATLPVPWLDPMTLMGHLVFGLVVGVVFPIVGFE